MARFSHEGWRERKQAVSLLVDLVVHEQPDADTMHRLIERLIDGVVHPVTVSSRAASQEALERLGRASVPHVVKRIRNRSEGARLLVDLIGALGTAAEVPLLIELAADADDENMRASAAAALGQLAEVGGPAAQRVLETMLDEPSQMLQLYALDALRTAEAKVAVERLAPLVGRPVTRKAAVAVLGHSESFEALPLLLPLLDEPMLGVRAAVVRSLQRLHRSMATAGQGSVVQEALAGLGAEARTAVRSLLSHRDAEVRQAAAEIVAMLGDADALPLILGAMEDPAIYEQAVKLVGRLGAGANGALVDALGAMEGGGSREQFLRLAGAIRAPAVQPRLMDTIVASLEDPSEVIAVAAADALREVGGRVAMGALYRCLSTDGPLGEHAADALAEVARRVSTGSHDELDLLIGGSWPHEGALARNLCRVVGRLGLIKYVPPLVSLLGSSDTSVRVAAAHAVGSIPGEHEGVGALCFALADEEPHVRAAACRSLGQLRAPQSLQPLLSATSDPSPLVRSAGVQALVAIDNPISLARLREIVLEDPSPTVVVHAIDGLGRSRLDQDLTLLMSLCSSSDHEVIKAAARGLRGFDAHRATAALLGLLSHDRWDVRWAASEVLAARGDVTAVEPLRRAADVEKDELVAQVIQKAIARLEALAGESR